MTKSTVHTVFLCLGTNLGDRENNLNLVAEHIARRCGKVIGESGFYISPSWGYESENSFYNQCLKIGTHFNPDDLIDILLTIEMDMGRHRESNTYRDRIIDIDVLFFDDMVIQTGKLLVPHPRIAERRFVLAPMVEIAPDFMHPVIGKSMQALLKACKDKGIVKRI